MTIKRPFYSHSPFRDCDALGWHLRVKGNELLELAKRSDQLYYYAGRKLKSDGTYREVYGALEPLKTVHKKILDRVLRLVDFPAYLMGGIRDRTNPRDYIRNASLHCGQRTLVQEDIASFYPSTTRAHVASIFRGVFHFPPDVAGCLASLCTRNGELAQGASPSTYLANLVMWDREPMLEARLRSMGLRYSRYIDDINVSCTRLLPANEQEEIVNALHSLIRSYGYSPKRSKQVLASIGRPMVIHSLSVNGTQPALSRDERSAIRAAVFQLEEAALAAPSATRTWKLALSAKSRVVIWRRLNPAQAEPLYARVDRVINRLRRYQSRTAVE